VATEILENHNTGASNGPTEGHNLCVKKVNRWGRLSILPALSATRPPPRWRRHSGQRDLNRPGSEPALPTHSRRAAKARLHIIDCDAEEVIDTATGSRSTWWSSLHHEPDVAAPHGILLTAPQRLNRWRTRCPRRFRSGRRHRA
jgi:hypothetical protein